MSEQAYTAGIRESDPPEEHDYDFTCPKCNQPAYDNEAGEVDGEKVCVNCEETNE